MPKPTKPPAKRGDTRTVFKPRPKRPARPGASPRGGQIRGGRPPRFPGRTGGR